MILLRVEASNMANDQLARKAKLPPHFLALGWVIGVSCNIYSIVDDLI